MKISENGLNLIKEFEGCRLTAYKPVATEKYWTIGWGHYGVDVKQGQTITQSKADEMLKNDMAEYENAVNKNCAYLNLNQNQFDALVSFTYNCGAGNLKQLIGNGSRNASQIAYYITSYNKSGRTILPGLTRRRNAEKELFLKPVEQVQIEISDIFDSDLYNLLYEDLNQKFKGNKEQLLEHYLQFGIKEGRRASYVFDVHFYLEKYSDLKETFGNDYWRVTEHFIRNGIFEGRQGSNEFDIIFYKNANSDLKNMSNVDALKHYLQFGINEGRASSTTFYALYYKNKYSDLQKVFGNNNKEYTKHYIQFGKKECRQAVG